MLLFEITYFLTPAVYLVLHVFSCYGQTLIVSTFIGETLYAICLAVVGLVLFAHLIGNVQVKSLLGL